MTSQSAGTFGPIIERLIFRYSPAIVIAVQLALVVASYVISFLLRLDLDISQVPWSLVLKTLPLLIVLRIGALVLFRLHRGLWRYLSIVDLIQVVKATTLSSAVFLLLEILIFGLEGFPRSIFVLDWAGNLFLLGGVRLFVRLVRERFRAIRGIASGSGSSKRLLIIGAGDSGASLCRQALNNSYFRFSPVAFVDDDTSKLGLSIQGVPIVGRYQDIARVAVDYKIDLAVVADTSATLAQQHNLATICQQTGVELKVLPDTSEIINGTISINHIRDVDPLDLLGRLPARLDLAAIDSFIRGKRVLVTGAAGSVGSELSRQIQLLQPDLLLLIDQAENPLLYLEVELRTAYPDTALVAQIVDVTDRETLCQLMSEYRPQIVLHAAAHKHVPFMERAPREAVRNNVGGTYTVAKCALESGVETFVLVSTDKAVRPTSIMGATKRLGEMLTQELNGEGPTQFITVRFGNVIGSNASVVPIFKQQILNGGPVTVTHQDVSRYFMSIPEAAGLILQAGAVGAGGEIVLLDMGAPVPIVKLAETMITLSGFKPYEGIDIVFTGLREGEKLHEELYSEGETFLPTGYDKLMVLKENHLPEGVVAAVEDFLRLLPNLNDDEVKAHLQHLVQDYHPAGDADPVVNTARGLN